MSRAVGRANNVQRLRHILRIFLLNHSLCNVLCNLHVIELNGRHKYHNRPHLREKTSVFLILLSKLGQD
jgi:hypothetical protein